MKINVSYASISVQEHSRQQHLSAQFLKSIARWRLIQNVLLSICCFLSPVEENSGLKMFRLPRKVSACLTFLQ